MPDFQVHTSYFRSFNYRMAAAGRKVLVITDNASSHKITGAKEEMKEGLRLLHLSNVTLCFLPPNVTSVVQPLDQGKPWDVTQYGKAQMEWNHQQLFRRISCNLHDLHYLYYLHDLYCTYQPFPFNFVAGIIASFKARYRQALLRWKIGKLELLPAGSTTLAAKVGGVSCLAILCAAVSCSLTWVRRVSACVNCNTFLLLLQFLSGSYA